jgi:hypothetical protein
MLYPRVSSDTLSIDALAIVAAFVRFNALDILFAPALAFAIVFNVRTSSFDHERRTIFFFLAMSGSFSMRAGLVTQQDDFASTQRSEIFAYVMIQLV